MTAEPRGADRRPAGGLPPRRGFQPGCLLLAAIVLAALPGGALAGGYELAAQAASAGGTGHAGAAREGDAAAAWTNPSALADGGGLRLALGASLGGPVIVATSLAGASLPPWESRTRNPLSVPPYVHASFARGAWAAGISAGLPFAGGVRWPDDWPGRFDVLESRPRFFRVSAFFGLALGPVRVAFGPHLDTGELYVRKATDHVDQEGQVRLSLRGWGVGADVALLARFSDHVQAGLVWRSRTVLALMGEADFDVPAAFAPRFPDGGVSSRLVLPDRLVAGVALRPKGLPRLAILVDMGVTFWAVNQELALDFEQEAVADSVQDNRWRTTAALRAGAEVTVHRAVLVRAGGYVDGLWGAPPPADTLSPSSPDSTRIGLTVGGRIAPTDWLAFDLFYEHVELLPRDSSSPDAIDAGYRGFANLGGLSASVTVPVRGKEEPPG